MMSPDLTVINPLSRNGEDITPSDSARSSGVRRTSPTVAKQLEPPPPQKCPRCDSPNTKFCYYNNYSLTQPRHFCKTCRRYWTKGGAFRNVPIGGGCRKNKKASTKSCSSRLSSSDSKDSAGSSSYSDIGGFKFFNNLSPAMEFQHGGLNSNFTKFQSPSCSGGANNNFIHHHQNYPVSFGDVSTPVASLNSGFALDPNATNAGGYLMGFNYPGLKLDDGNVSGFSGGLMQQFYGTSNNNRNNLSSIESLSSMNQDLHWKLQQERLAVFFGGGDDNLNINNNNNINVNNNNNNNGHQVQKPQPILFENLEINSSKSAGDYSHYVVGGGGGAVASRKDATTDGSDHGGCIGSLATEWYFDKFSCFAPAVNPTLTTSGSTSNGIQGWNGNFDQYTALP